MHLKSDIFHYTFVIFLKKSDTDYIYHKNLCVNGVKRKFNSMVGDNVTNFTKNSNSL